MNVLILGGHGFIGCHVSNILKFQGHNVSVVDCYHQYNIFPDWEYQPVLEQRKDWANADSVHIGKIEDEHFLEHAFRDSKPDVVIHLATYPNAHMVKNNPVDATGNMITANINILNACVKHNVKRIVFSSSSMVYGDFLTDSPDETHPTNPLTLYGSYKLQGEKMCEIWNREHGLEYVIMRPSALYGTRDMIVRVISQMTKSALLHDKIVVNGPDNKLDFSYVEDVADYFVGVAFHPDAKNQKFNCTRGRGRTIMEAAKLVQECVDKGFIETQPHDTFYPNRDTLDSSKIKQVLGYTPTTDIEQGIPLYVNWFLKQEFISKI